MSFVLLHVQQPAGLLFYCRFSLTDWHCPTAAAAKVRSHSSTTVSATFATPAGCCPAAGPSVNQLAHCPIVTTHDAYLLTPSTIGKRVIFVHGKLKWSKDVPTIYLRVSKEPWNAAHYYTVIINVFCPNRLLFNILAITRTTRVVLRNRVGGKIDIVLNFENDKVKLYDRPPLPPPPIKKETNKPRTRFKSE